MFAKKKTKLARTSRQKRKHLLGRSMKNANQTLAASIKKGGAVKENHGNQVSSVCLSFTSVTPSNRRKSITDSVRKKVALFSSDAINNPCRWVFFLRSSQVISQVSTRSFTPIHNWCRLLFFFVGRAVVISGTVVSC